MTDAAITALVAAALAEDGPRDITSDVCIAPGTEADAVVECRTAVVLAGTAWADEVLRACGLPPMRWVGVDGTACAAGTVAGRVRGDLRALLRAERTLLNLLQRASGIATVTAAYVAAVAGTGTRILHTRKTAPGLRRLDVAGVLAGGGNVHRLGLDEAVMIKDNHWAWLAASGRTVAAALAAARDAGVHRLYVEVESVGQVEQACAAGATRLLVDNQTPETVATWGRLARSRSPGIEIEATGGLTLGTVRAFADAGADYLSIGALTHSVPAADLALELTATFSGA